MGVGPPLSTFKTRGQMPEGVTAPDERYVPQGGQAGYDRLVLLSRERWPDTERLLLRAGLSPGMRCLDLGCGGGQVTIEIAKRIAPGGTCVGLDLDEVKLRLARKAAADLGVSNVEFRVGSIAEWDEPSTYDLVYSRFVVQHLGHPVEALRRMWRAVRSPGVLVVEDTDHEGWFMHPPNPGFDFYVRSITSVLPHGGGDATAGRKLFAYFREIGVPDPEVSLVTPLRSRPEEMSVTVPNLEGLRDALVSTGLASSSDVDAARTHLVDAIQSPGTLLGGPRIFQLIGRKP